MIALKSVARYLINIFIEIEVDEQRVEVGSYCDWAGVKDWKS